MPFVRHARARPGWCCSFLEVLLPTFLQRNLLLAIPLITILAVLFRSHAVEASIVGGSIVAVICPAPVRVGTERR